MTDPTDPIERLRALAEDATAGPWTCAEKRPRWITTTGAVEIDEADWGQPENAHEMQLVMVEDPRAWRYADVRYVAAANPAAVLDLIAERDRLLDANERLREALDSTSLRAITLEQIADQRAKGWPDFHPEDYCHRCGHRNISWYTDHDLFNAAIGHPDGIDPVWRGIICPQCFVELHDETYGRRSSWRLLRMDRDTVPTPLLALTEEAAS